MLIDTCITLKIYEYNRYCKLKRHQNGGRLLKNIKKCDLCNYETLSNKDFKIHLRTNKHISRINASWDSLRGRSLFSKKLFYEIDHL